VYLRICTIVCHRSGIVLNKKKICLNNTRRTKNIDIFQNFKNFKQTKKYQKTISEV